MKKDCYNCENCNDFLDICDVTGEPIEECDPDTCECYDDIDDWD